MENRGIKRKHYEIIKNDMSVELQKLTVISGDYNNDVQEANVEFAKIFKSMSDKQDEFLSRSLLITEQYRATLAALEGEKADGRVESTGENPVLPQSYVQDARRFADDAKTSLNGHGVFLNQEYEEMGKTIVKYEGIWKEKLEEMKRHAAAIAGERSKLTSALTAFTRYVPEDTDDDSNEDEEDY